MNTVSARNSSPVSILESIERELGAPAFHHPGVLIYQGDALELMRRMQGSPVALTVTSPPYNIGKEYETSLEVNDYLVWCEEWIKQIYQITAPHGAFWLNLGYLSLADRAKAIPIPYLLWDRLPFFLVQEIVWHYAAGVASRRSFSPRNEKFLWNVKNSNNYTFNLDAVRDPNVKYPNQKKHGKLKCNPKGKNPSDVWMFPKVTSGTGRASRERTQHPAQFPVAVIDRIIKACSRKGELIFDPFLGSGTVAEVAMRNGRAVIGFEIEPKYVRIATSRVKRVIREVKDRNAQTALFPV